MSAEVRSLQGRRFNSKEYSYPLHLENWFYRNWQACCSKAAAWIFSLKGRLFLVRVLAVLLNRSADTAVPNGNVFHTGLESLQAEWVPGKNCTWFTWHTEAETTALYWCQRRLEAVVSFLRTWLSTFASAGWLYISHFQCWLFFL